MKSSEAQPTSVMQFHKVRLADLEVDMLEQTVRRSGRRLPVRGRSFQLLRCLIERSPQTARHRELLDEVWHDVVVTPDALSQRVRLLRKALDDDKGDAGYIVSVHGQGYRLSQSPQRDELAESRIHARPRVNLKAAGAALALVAFPLLAILINGDVPHAIKHFFKHLFI